MIIIGLTGGIGSGKTAVSDYFAGLGIDVIDADVITHKLTQKGSDTLKKLQHTFGDWVIDQEGNYDRKAMRAYVFDNPNALQKLNAIMHPAIKDAINQALAMATSSYVILSVPLLFETRHNQPSLLSLCDCLLVIDVPTSLQQTRASQRDGNNLAQIQSIIDKQISRADRLALATTLGADIIQNTGTLDELFAKLAPLHQKYQQLAQSNTDQ